MDRWKGFLKIQLCTNSNAFYRVAASLALSSSPKNLAVPSGNAIFFCGDRVEGTNNPVIERLSDPHQIAETLVSKFGGSINAYVVEASIFNGPFAVYKDFIPSVNENGEPQSYDATGFPASLSLVQLLSKFLEQAKNVISGKQKEPSAPFSSRPQTALLGFSKGGTVLNQFLAELASLELQSTETSAQGIKNVSISEGVSSKIDDWIIPTSKEGLLNSIVEIHYVDVGLNADGAYLTDKNVLDRFSEHLTRRASGIRFLFHGTPRQWCDDRRMWIRKEKDALVRLLQNCAHKNKGKVGIRERLYFPGKFADIQMHFEIIDKLDVN